MVIATTWPPRRRARVVWLALIASLGLASAASSGPITFSSAITLAPGELVLREQFVFDRASDDASAANREFEAIGVVSVLGYAVSRDLMLFGVLPYFDKRLELTVGGTPVFGYGAGERIRTPDSQDIVMNIKLGDTILFNDPGLTSSSRNTSVHNFTIDEFGIDVAVPIGERGPSLLFTPDRAGTFRVYCSVHPDDHGTVTLIVEA